MGTNTFEGGLHILDVSNPIQPVLAGDFSQDGYTHDAQVVVYNGPDSNFQGKEIAFACNENTVTIADVSDPSDTYMISAQLTATLNTLTKAANRRSALLPCW